MNKPESAAVYQMNIDLTQVNDDELVSDIFSEALEFGDQISTGLKLVVDFNDTAKVAYLGRMKSWNDGRELWYAYGNSQISVTE